MKKNIPISKISYLYEDWKYPDDKNAITYIVKKPIYSYIESSYNSIVMMNVYNGDKTNPMEYNYLVFIDENGVGHPLNSVTYSAASSSSTINDPGITCVYPPIEITNLLDNYPTIEGTLKAVNEINTTVNTLSLAVENIVNVLNDSRIRTTLGLNGSTTDATTHISNATEYSECVRERYSALADVERISTEVSENPKKTDYTQAVDSEFTPR